MPPKTDESTITVVLLGNPNTGKSTLFSALVGVQQRIGNYPGVTVEKKVGHTELGGRSFVVIDLPGTYSLAPRSPDEMVAVEVLLGRREDVPAPDVIICIVDAGNLERNLYLVSQAMELARPVVVVLNKTDIARERKISVDLAQLQQRLGVPVVAMQAHRRIGLDDLRQALIDAASSTAPNGPSPFPPEFCSEVERLQEVWSKRSGDRVPRYLAERLLLDTVGYLAQANSLGGDRHLQHEISQARERLKSGGIPVPAVETTCRYQWVDRVLDGVERRPREIPSTVTDWIDRVLTNRFVGAFIFFALMVLVFQSIFTWTEPLTDAIETMVGRLGQWIATSIPEGVVRSLFADGVVAGVGAVLVFVPQIAMLFLFIAILEDCGYMARAAYLMDNLMSRVGLSGKSFIPLLSSHACAVPGIMATRVIEDRRDRLVTILVAPLMSCSARLPVYTLLIAAFIPNRRFFGHWLGLQGVVMFALYAIGIITAVSVARMLKQTLLKGQTPPFIMELPDYRIPSPRVVLSRVIEQSWSFVRGAGTLILAVTVIVWAAAYFPRPAHIETEVRKQFADDVAALTEQVALLENDESTLNIGGRDEQLALLRNRQAELESSISDHVAGAYMQQSILGRLGKLIAPVVRPLGWDWRIGCAVIASFPAREVVIGAMGVIYNLGEVQDEESQRLRDELQKETWPGTDRPVFTIPVALSIMVFFALCAQCAATLVVIRKETGSAWWSLFTFGYMTCLAYVGALLTYQIGTWIGS